MSSFSKGKFSTNQNFGKNIREIVNIEDIPIYFDQPLWFRVEQDGIC